MKATCTKCKITKDSSLFRPYKLKRNGLRSTCKKCDRTHEKEYRSRPEIKARDRVVNKKRNRVYRFKKYGITEDNFIEMLKSQLGKCSICFMEIKGKNIHIDHCHKTKIVRGLLCRQCNQGLGYFNDDTYLVQKAIEYLSIAA